MDGMFESERLSIQVIDEFESVNNGPRRATNFEEGKKGCNMNRKSTLGKKDEREGKAKG